MVFIVSIKKRAIAFLPLLFFAAVSMGAVPVHINSGNPAYPFPQFLEYACGGNLGTKNPEGISHAEMEKFIREAYQQHANSFKYTGDEHQGIKYIDLADPSYAIFSESDGYGLLAAAYMADKATFDGYWMCTHDKRRVRTKRYKDCTDNAPDYRYGEFTISWREREGGEASAGDADADIALALYVAYKQWGEFMRNDKGEIVKDACGEPISYKQELINVIRGMVKASVDSETPPYNNILRVTTGLIGLDGYVKGGNTYSELTDWASQEKNFIQMDGLNVIPMFEGKNSQFTDYCAPAYYREFRELLDSLSGELGETNAWEVEQFRRGEASSDWLIGNLIGKNEKALPIAGKHTVNRNGDTTTFSVYSEGEDFRTPWRTISNYVWHGSPAYSWNPVTHQVESKANTYEYDAAVRLSDYMRDPAHWTPKNSCFNELLAEPFPSISGPRIMGWKIDPMTGESIDPFVSVVWPKGASSFAAIGVQDYDLMGDLFHVIYEQGEMLDSTTADGQLIARYMHGWFRQLGLMSLTGNYVAPSQMKAQPNLKIYRALKDSMSYCHVGDTITYLLSYRNYGSVDAQNVSIVENVPEGFIFLDADNGGKYDAATRTVKWSLSKLAGFKSDDMVGASIDYSAPNLSKTIGQVSYRCVAKDGAKGRYQASAEISCSNGLGSKTDLYPNYVTATMQRNAIDVVPSGLSLTKASNVSSVAKGDLITFNVSLANDSVPALTGGRSGVNVTLAETKDKTMSTLMMRLYNDALEPIDYGNYRISVFDGKCRLTPFGLAVGDTAPSINWTNMFSLVEGLPSDSGFVFKNEMLADSTFMRTIQFPHMNAASTSSLLSRSGATHPSDAKTIYPLNVVVNTRDAVYNDIDWGTGFSQIPQDELSGAYYPVTPSFQSSNQPKPVTRLLDAACDEVSKFTENVLVEEFDGYAWRKILGNSPSGNGEVATNVMVTDTIPLGFEFVKFMDGNAPASYRPAKDKPYAGIVIYSLDSMSLGKKNSFSYQCKCVATESCSIQLVSHVASDKESVNSAPLTIRVKGTAPVEGDPVTVHINSGNPAYPFPQFLEYACGGNLGTNVPEGVSHAEMEKYIREAYQLHANEFAYTGEEYQGIKYIWTPYKAAYDCTEGDGYALLAAAYMADKATFDGYWMCTHDKRRARTKRYMDCSDNAPDYSFGDFPILDYGTSGTAADGDVDVALALYVAYKQWGEFMRNDKGEIVKDACDEPISYKQEMINVIRGLVAMSTRFPSDNPRRVNSGLIGLDGYMKGGDTWNELTDWASQKENYLMADSVPVIPEFVGGQRMYTDYSAPAYFREFHDLLVSLSSELGETNTWEAEQFRRGEASSDWIIGNLIRKSEKALPTAGWHTVSRDGDSTTFATANGSTDFRCAWRTISNYVWHGSPAYSWNPATHQVESKANSYERDAALKLSDYMRDPAHWTSENSCVTYGVNSVPVTGPRTLDLMINPMTGATFSSSSSSSGDGFFSFLARQKGAFSFAAIGGQDYDLMGDLFSSIYESGDVKVGSEGGVVVPVYMDGWFRQMGLMALTGNYAAPSQMKAQPNLKIYRAVKDSVSFCHVGDTITYLLSYRNYGSVDAQNVSIVENVPDGFVFLDAANGGKYDAATHTVKWSLSKLAGFKSDDMEGASIDYSAPNLSKTIGQVSYRCVAKEGAKGRYQASAEISCSNGVGSKTDGYPNYVTATMQRNAVDVIPTNLAVVKVADATEVATGDLVTFNVSLSNDTVPALTGGRPGVSVALAEEKGAKNSNLMLKIYHDAKEPCIDYGNYRVTVFNGKCYVNLPSGDSVRMVNWAYSIPLIEGIHDAKFDGKADSGFVFTDEILADSSIMRTIQFPHVLAASTYNLGRNAGSTRLPICGGANYPLRVVISAHDASYYDIEREIGFSQLSQDELDGSYYPVSPSYQSSEEPQPVDRLMKSACDEVSTLTENVLVEEFDGYTWRKILGNAPAGYGDVETNVTLTDTIPLGFEFVKFTDENTTATYQPASATANPRPNGREASFMAAPDGAKNYSGIVTYTLNRMNTGEKNSFSYQCRVVATEADTIRCVSHVSSDKESVNSAPLVLYIKEATSLPSVEAESPYVDVYNMLGVMLKKQVLREKALDGLMPGVYVVGDQKMVKTVKD